jgi:hypothetical protein
MDNNNNNNPNDSLLARPAQALRILMGIDNMGIKKLKGQAALIDKPGTIDDLEKRVPKNFLGYNDGTALDRVSKYREFDRMDVLSPEIHTALDIYAEEASQNDNKTGLKVWIDSEKPNVAEELNAMLQRIKQDKKVYGHYRNLAKYGDLFLYLNLGGYGIHDTYYVHPSRMERIQSDGLLGFKSQDLAQIIPMDNKEGLFPPWSFVHMTCGAYDNESVYGSSFLDALRKAWNQLSQLELMICLYRISKAVQRNVFEVDTGQSSIPEAMQIVKEYDKMLRNKTTFIDPVTKQFKLDFNPATLLQDIIWPTRPGSTSKITQLKSDGNLGSLEDLEYWKNKMRMGLGIPKDYFDGEYSGTWNSKEALMLQDVRFGRKISKLQDGLRDGMVRLCQIHWAITHQEFLDPSAFIVNLGSISDSAERGREEVLLRKAQVLEILANVSVVLGWNRWAWSDYLLDEVFPLPAKLRQKFYTPDPKEEMDQEAALELKKVGGSNGPGGTQKGGGSSKAKPNKPAKKATPDSVRRGLMKFGGKESLENIYEEFPTVLEEIEQIEGELEEIEEHVEYLNSNSQYGFKKGEIDELIKVYKKTDVLPLNESTTKLTKEEFDNERAKALFIESRKINIIKLNKMANAPEPIEFVE